MYEPSATTFDLWGGRASVTTHGPGDHAAAVTEVVRWLAEVDLAASTWREDSGALCFEAHAAIWLSRGRVRKYRRVSAVERRSTLPRTTTCRSSPSQGKSRAARGFSRSWRAFSLSRLVKKTKPRSSKCFRRTVRAAGKPSAPAVASVMAFGSAKPPSIASRNQAVNCASGSDATSSSRSAARPYWRRIAAGSGAESRSAAMGLSGERRGSPPKRFPADRRRREP